MCWDTCANTECPLVISLTSHGCCFCFQAGSAGDSKATTVRGSRRGMTRAVSTDSSRAASPNFEVATISIESSGNGSDSDDQGGVTLIELPPERYVHVPFIMT